VTVDRVSVDTGDGWQPLDASGIIADFGGPLRIKGFLPEGAWYANVRFEGFMFGRPTSTRVRADGRFRRRWRQPESTIGRPQAGEITVDWRIDREAGGAVNQWSHIIELVPVAQEAGSG